MIHAKEDATVVQRAYNNEEYADQFEKDIHMVREALVNAVNVNHPAHSEDPLFQYEIATAFMKHFGKVFFLNDDLLLYLVNLEQRLLKDSFGLERDVDEGRYKSPFLEHAYCHILKLHGALHLSLT